MSFTKEQAEVQLEQLMKENRWEEVLQVYRRMADELHEEPSFVEKALRRVKPDAEQLRAEDTGSSLWLLGMMYYESAGGVVQNWEEEAFLCFSRAAEKGHLLSRWKVGYMTARRLEVPQDRARGHALMLEAAEGGCTEAFYWAGQAYENGWGVQQSYRRAVQWYLKAQSSVFALMLRERPLECAPFGEWRPELTPLVPREILQAMRTAMLLCKRLQLPRYVALLIASYVSTEGEEWVQLLRLPPR